MSEQQSNSKTDEEEQERPSQLPCQKTRVYEGRHYIDTSDESSCGGGPDTNETAPDEHMVSFVAEDLQHKIRMSSPTASESAGPSTSSNSPSPYPPLLPDAQVLIDIEQHAKGVSTQLDQVLREFKGSMHGMCDLSVECLETYNSSITNTCDHVDSSIKSMYQMLAKAEELSHVLRPLPRLAQQIKEIKRVLDLFESHMQKSIG